MRVGRLLCGLVLVLAVAGLSRAMTGAGADNQNATRQDPGGITTALDEALSMPGLVYEVEVLNIQAGWAWIQVLPRSADGANQYEDVCALLRLEHDVWRVVELPCTEEDNPDCLTSPDYFSGLARRFPDLPAGILP